MPFKNARPLGRVSLLLALALVTMTGLCAWTSSCGTAAHKASVAAASIGASLQTAATVNHEMLTAGEETAAEGALVAGYIDQAAKSNDAFTKTLQSLPDSGSQLTSTQAITAFNTLVTQITRPRSRLFRRRSHPPRPVCRAMGQTRFRLARLCWV